MIEFSDIVEDVSRAEFLKGSPLVAFVSLNGKIELREIEAFGRTTSLPSVEPQCQVAFSPDYENYLAFSTKKATCDLYNIRGERLASIAEMGMGIDNAVWAPDSCQVLVFSSFQLRITIYNLLNNSKCYIRSPKYATKGFSFSQDGRFMALAERRQARDCIGIYFTKDWTLVNYFQTDMLDLCDLMWAPNSNFLVAWDTCLNYKLVPICPFMGLVKSITPYESALGIKTVAYSHNSRLLAVGSFDEKIRLFNALTWEMICQLECKPSIITRPDVNFFKEDEEKDSNRVRSNFRLVESALFKIPTAKPAAIETLTTLPKEGVGLLEFSHDDSFLAFRNDNMSQTVWIYDMQALDYASVVNFVKPVRNFKWSPTESLLCITTNTNHIYFWSGGDRLITACDVPYEQPMQVLKIKWSEDGKRFLLYDKSSVCLSYFTEGPDEQS